jgi:hypothetical protein
MYYKGSRDPRLVTMRRGSTLKDADHRLLGVWAAARAAGHAVAVAHMADHEFGAAAYAIRAIRVAAI